MRLNLFSKRIHKKPCSSEDTRKEDSPIGSGCYLVIEQDQVGMHLDLTQLFPLQQVLGRGHRFPDQLQPQDIEVTYNKGVIYMKFSQKSLSRPSDDASWRPGEENTPMTG